MASERRGFTLYPGNLAPIQFSVTEGPNALDRAIGAADALTDSLGASFYTLNDDEGENVLAGAHCDVRLEEARS